MKITFIRLFNNKKEKDEAPLMKFLRDNHEKPKHGKHARSRHDERRARIIAENRHKKSAEKTAKSNDMFIKNIKDLFDKKIVKKNQVVLVATALMLVTAGYMNYTNNIKMAELGDAQLVSANAVSEPATNEPKVQEKAEENENNNVEQNSDENKNVDNEVNSEENAEETVETTAKNTDDYFSKTRLERETMFSQMLETYQKILENNSIPNDQKSIASNEIKNINDKKSAIATMENLIKTKGIEDVVILFNDSSVNVVAKSPQELTKEQVAQITNIVSREADVEIENIHVSTQK